MTFKELSAQIQGLKICMLHTAHERLFNLHMVYVLKQTKYFTAKDKLLSLKHFLVFEGAIEAQRRL